MKHTKMVSVLMASALLFGNISCAVLPVSAKSADTDIQVTTESSSDSDIQFSSLDDGITFDNSDKTNKTDSNSDIELSDSKNADESQSSDKANTSGSSVSSTSAQTYDSLKAVLENTTENSLSTGDKAKIHVTSENSTEKEAVLRLYFCNIDGEMSSDNSEWGNYLSQPSLDLKIDGLNDKSELSVDVTDKDGKVSKGTISFLKTVSNDEVTARYATLTLPAGAKTEFDLTVTSSNQTTATIIPVMEQEGFHYRDAVSVKWEESITFLDKVSNFFTGNKSTSTASSDDINIEDVQGEEINLQTSSSEEQTLSASVTTKQTSVKTGKSSKLSVSAQNTTEKDATFKLYLSKIDDDLSSDKTEWLSYLRQPATNVSVDGFDKNDTKKVKITVDGKEKETTLRIVKDIEDDEVVSRYITMDLPANATAEFDISVISDNAEKVSFIPFIKQDEIGFGDAATVEWKGSKNENTSVSDIDEIQGAEQEKNAEKDTVSCELKVHGGNGYVVIFDDDETFEKTYRYEDDVLYDEDGEVVDVTNVELPKSKDLIVSLVADTHYCIESVSLKDKDGKDAELEFEQELPAYLTSFDFKAEDDMSLDIEFLLISKKYIDEGVSAMDVNVAGWWDYGVGRNLCEFLGIDGNTYYNYLKEHSQDDWYIGTPYTSWDAVTGYADGANGIGGWCNGAGYGMNCEGFVDNVLFNTGASHPMAKGAGSIRGWVGYMNHEDLQHYVFSSKAEMLSSGVLAYGDIIYMFVGNGHNYGDAYHHIGIFVGNTSSDDKFWHSVDAVSNQYGTTVDGNQITNIIPKRGDAFEWVVVKAGAIPKEYTNLTVSKNWSDKNNKYGTRPDCVHITLYRDDEAYSDCWLSDENGWTYTWYDMVKLENGHKYSYRIEEDEVDGYTLEYDMTDPVVGGFHSVSKNYAASVTNTVKLGYLKLHKSSSLPNITDGNPCYNLSGAEYTVYYDEACTQVAACTGSLITDENGDTDIVELKPGDYWVKETKTTDDEHYEKDKEAHFVSVTADNTTDNPALLEVTDVPGNDPANITITKIWDGEKTATVPPLTGTQFTICYYAGDYEKNTLPSTPTRKWVVEVKYNKKVDKYIAGLTESYLVKDESDALYKDEDGLTVLPYGTYTIQETKEAAGYTLEGSFTDKYGNTISPKEVYVSKVLKHGDSIKLEGGNEYSSKDTPKPSKITLKKYDTDGKTPLAGAKFELKNAKGEVVATKTADSNGVIEFTDLYPDIYTITELKTSDKHTLLEEPITVKCPMTVTEQDIKTYNIDKNQCVYDDKQGVYYIFNQTYNVTNDATFVVPMTGGVFTPKMLIPLGAGLAIMTCALYITLRKKRRV